MAKIVLALVLASFVIGVVLSSRANADQKDWCIAQVGSAPPKMQGFLDYACGVTDCKLIQPGGRCFKPNNIYNHVSFALNQEYRRTGICNAEIGYKTTDDPSYGHCHYS